MVSSSFVQFLLIISLAHLFAFSLFQAPRPFWSFWVFFRMSIFYLFLIALSSEWNLAKSQLGSVVLSILYSRHLFFAFDLYYHFKSTCTSLVFFCSVFATVVAISLSSRWNYLLAPWYILMISFCQCSNTFSRNIVHLLHFSCFFASCAISRWFFLGVYLILRSGYDWYVTYDLPPFTLYVGSCSNLHPFGHEYIWGALPLMAVQLGLSDDFIGQPFIGSHFQPSLFHIISCIPIWVS